MSLSAEIHTETSPDHEHNEDFVRPGWYGVLERPTRP
jgi:hypothetical protein